MIPLVLTGMLSVAFCIGVLVGMAHRPKERPTRTERRELVATRTVLEDVRRIAYEHMTTDPNLAAIVVDEINTYERKAQQ